MIAVKQFDRKAAAEENLNSSSKYAKEWFQKKFSRLLESEAATFEQFLTVLLSKLLDIYKEDNKDQLSGLIQKKIARLASQKERKQEMNRLLG